MSAQNHEPEVNFEIVREKNEYEVLVSPYMDKSGGEIEIKVTEHSFDITQIGSSGLDHLPRLIAALQEIERRAEAAQ